MKILIIKEDKEIIKSNPGKKRFHIYFYGKIPKMETWGETIPECMEKLADKLRRIKK